MNTITQLVLVLLTLVPGPVVAEGKATHYCEDCPRAMHHVIPNRVKWDQIHLNQPHVGYVALADCGYLDQLVVLQVPDRQRLVGPLLVADCGAMQDQKHLESIDFAVDLSWDLAKRLGTINAPLFGVKVYLWRGLVSEVHAQ